MSWTAYGEIGQGAVTTKGGRVSLEPMSGSVRLDETVTSRRVTGGPAATAPALGGGSFTG
jgi:hypothetical protein